MADLFTLFGTIALDYKDAETTIDRLLTKTKLLQERLDNTGGSGSSGGSGGSGASTGGAGTTGTGTAGANLTVAPGGSTTKSFVKSQLILKGLQFVGNTTKKVATTGLEWAKDYETSIINIQTMTGKAYEEAKAYYDQMLKLDIETPLNADSISKAVSTLLVNGTPEEQILPLLRVLGDVSRGDNSTFSSVVEATAKALAGGKMDGVVSRQLVSAEIPIYDLLAELYGMTGTQQENTAALYEMREKGLISGQDIIDAFTLYTQPGHGAYNAMANAMQTTKGIEEQTAALAEKAAGRLVQEAGIDQLYENAVKKTGEVMEQFTNWLDTDTDKPFGEKVLDTFLDGARGLARPIYDALTIKTPDVLMPSNMQEALLAFQATGNPAYLELFGNTNNTNKTSSFLDKLFIPGSPEEYAEKYGKGAGGNQQTTTDPQLAYIIEGLKNGTLQDPMGGMGIPVNSGANNAAAIIAAEVSTAVQTAIAETVPDAVASGMGNVTITTGNVTMNDGALVGRILPRINRGLGQIAMRDWRE